ncbi:MAG TPA: dihydrodipicolinate synthase family protein [Planctomycetota bacterium]|nr:dihydrodipicolinate synthase family protein [Planctomycetota bacterium]
MAARIDARVKSILARGVVLPAHPLALTSERTLDERRQRALSRYYIDAGAGGLAVGVHTTQFAIRDPRHGLFRPVLELAKEEMDRADLERTEPLVRIGGIVGRTGSAVAEAEILRELGYHAGLLGLGAFRDEPDEDAVLAHVRAVAEVIPIFGFYLQPAVGGRELPYSFWRRFAEIEDVVAIKIACFDRYRTLDVVRAVVASGREDIALYTGNDDQIVLDLVTPFRFRGPDGKPRERRIVGGLLGQWAVWTRRAVELLESFRAMDGAAEIPANVLTLAAELTDANGAIFDAANGFHGCIAGVHEVLRRQGLLESVVLLDPKEGLGPGQAAEIDRVLEAYPHLADNDFVREGLDRWLR